MDTSEIKKEIMRIVDRLPEHVLPEILEHIKKIQTSFLIDKIIAEDSDLLKRLAE